MQLETDPSVYHAQFVKGKKFRVTRGGCSISGTRPVGPWTRECFRVGLEPGDFIMCEGKSQTRGDGVPAVKWSDQDGKPYGEDAIFSPVVGGMWGGQIPKPGYLEEVE